MIKTLQKQEFLTFLKEIVDILEKENIKYDIPFCHIDKITYNYINILIFDGISMYDLSKIFNLDNVKKKDRIIYTTYKDFAVNFIITNLNDWGYTFQYYCWNILPTLINAMIKPFNLEYSNKCLNFVCDDKRIFL